MTAPAATKVVLPPISTPMVDRAGLYATDAWYRYFETALKRSGGDIDIIAAAYTYADTVSAAALVAAKAYADAGDATTLAAAKIYADGLLIIAEAFATAGDVTTLASAHTYADSGDATTLAAAKTYADTKDAANLVTAKAYADAQDVINLAAAEAFATAGDVTTLASAHTYADSGDATTLSSAHTYADAGDVTTLAAVKTLIQTIVEDKKSNINCATTGTTLCSVILPAGKWRIKGSAVLRGSVHTNDYATVCISTTPNAISGSQWGEDLLYMAHNAAQVTGSCTFTDMDVNGGATYYMCVAPNSTADNYSGYLKAEKIG